MSLPRSPSQRNAVDPSTASNAIRRLADTCPTGSNRESVIERQAIPRQINPRCETIREGTDECLFPALPGSGQENPEEAIELTEFRPPTSSVQNGDLLPEREVLECQLRAEMQGGRNQREQPQNHQGHAWEVSGPEARKVDRFNAAWILAKDNFRTSARHR